MQRRAIPVQKGAPWEFVELLMAAAGVDEDVAWLEVEVMVDVGATVVATSPDDVGETELSGDDGKAVLSDVVAYKYCKHALVYEMMTRLTEAGADICDTASSCVICTGRTW